MNISLYFCNDDLVNNIMQMVVDLVQKKIFVKIYLVYETKVLVGSYQNRFCTKEDHCKVAGISIQTCKSYSSVLGENEG